MLAILFSGRHPFITDDHGHYFLDRDPKYFSFILNYLRNYPNEPNECDYPDEDSVRIYWEADFFGIEAITNALKSKLKGEPFFRFLN